MFHTLLSPVVFFGRREERGETSVKRFFNGRAARIELVINPIP